MGKSSSLYVGLDVHRDGIDMGAIESVRCTGGARGARHGLANPPVAPAGPARADIGLEQDPGMGQDRGGPLPGADQLLKLAAFFGH